MLEMRPYHIGDMAKVPCGEADPWEGWCEQIESLADGLRSVELNGHLVACFGFVLVTPGVVDSLAVIDRERVKGYGFELARIFHKQTLAWMDMHRLHRAAATCSPTDKAAAVFLRAIGYRRECLLEAAAPDGSDLLQFKLIRR